MNTENSLPSATSAWKLFVAAAVGAFFLGVGDYMRHTTQSTVIALAGALHVGQVWAFFVLAPILGIVAAWIYKPSTEKDAFALGLAVFSIFALVPGQPENIGITDKIGTSPPEIRTGLNLSVSAFAQEAAAPTASANVTLQFEGSPPPESRVSVTNLTQDTQLGTFAIRDRLKLVGKPGDRIQLNFEAAGHQRTEVEVPLAAVDRAYQVRLQENATPLFFQRLVPAQTAQPTSMP
jgi:hypothetical protein